MNENINNISSNEINLSFEKEKEKLNLSNVSEEIISHSENNEENCQNVISQFTKIKRCSVLKYGISLSSEKIKFGYCHTCDKFNVFKWFRMST